MTWIKRATVPAHTCAPPMLQVTYTAPTEVTLGRNAVTSYAQEVDGQLGELWRCNQCGRLWRVADACDACDWYGSDWPHRGMCTLGLRWRPAKLGQRLQYWRRR